MIMDEPQPHPDERVLLRHYLDYYRDVVVTKLGGLGEDELRASILPSGWSPLELLKHLVFMERRWFQWGLEGADVDDPWGDGRHRWTLAPADTLATLTTALAAVAARTAQTLQTVDLDAAAPTGGRFRDDPPTARWICLHVLQEYARHAGHLDIVRELIDRDVGES